jgi:hypothetical protein
MELREIVSVTGVGGLKKLVANRNDGLVLSDLNGENKKFYSSRQHMFSPLENISLYTETDMVALGEVLWKMKEQKDAIPPVDPNAPNDMLRAYLGKIQPDFDRERVNISDIKKLIKWFLILDEAGVIQKPETPEEPAAE